MAQLATAIFTFTVVVSVQTLHVDQDLLAFAKYSNIFPNQTFEHKTSNDHDMDPCKSGRLCSNEIEDNFVK